MVSLRRLQAKGFGACGEEVADLDGPLLSAEGRSYCGEELTNIASLFHDDGRLSVGN